MEIARQFTIREYNMFAAIEARELLGQAWKTHTGPTVSPNVVALLRHSMKLQNTYVRSLSVAHDDGRV